jgi:hypothetical protein
MKIIGANVTGSFILNSQDVTTTIQTSNVWSGSVATDITALNAATASLLNYTASNNAAISDILLETASINTFTSSIDNRTSVIEGKYITTGSNTFVGVQYVSNTTQATTFTSTASLYTDGGLRIGKDAYVSGSAFIKGNLTVFGTSSIEYVTSSVFVGLEYIDLNTDLPALRYAGIRVYDSGSNVGVTGSLFWDSQTNHWVYSNPSGSSYAGGMMISGPRASSLGSEQGTTNNALMKGQGGDHITSSAILDDGTSLRIPYLTIINGTVGATAFSGSGANLTSIPNAALTNSTISGIALGSNLATLTIGTGLSGTSYNGSGAVTIACTITNNNQLTNGAGYITTSALSNYVTLDGTQTITGLKTINNNLLFADSGTTKRGIQGTCGANDMWFVGGGATATNAGFLEISTGDDGQTAGSSEPIYARQYGPGDPLTGTLVRTAALLDASGNTSFPGTVTAPTFSGALSGNASTATSAGTLSANSSISGLNFSGVFALVDSGASTSNSTGARLTESYGPVWNCGNGATWHHQVINGSSLVGISAAGTNFGSGNILASGNITAYYSDMRLKTKISNIKNALDKVLSLNGFYYVNNNIAKKYGYTSDKIQIGVSAQEIEAVLPEVVTLAPFDITGDDEGNALSKSGEYYKTVSYEKIVPLLIEAIKEQQTQIEELKSIINGLTK